MKRALNLLDQLGDIVKGKPRLEVAEIAGFYLKFLAHATGYPVRQPTPQRLIDDITERPARAA